MIATHEITVHDDTVYTVYDSVSASVGLKWIEDYFEEPTRSDLPADEVEAVSLRQIAQNMSDFDFLAQHVLVDAKAVEIPFSHVPELLVDMRKSLHIGSFMDAIARGLAPAEEDADFPADKEKNVPSANG